MAPWPSGKAKVCNTSTPSPNLGGASKTKEHPKGCSFVLEPLRPFGLAPCNLLHGNQFAFLTKQRLPLASNLVGKNSSQSELSGWCPQTGALSFWSHSVHSDLRRATCCTGSSSQMPSNFDLSGELQSKNIFFFEKKKQKAFMELRGV